MSNFFYLPTSNLSNFHHKLKASPEMLSMGPCTLKLDEEKSKYVGLA